MSKWIVLVLAVFALTIFAPGAEAACSVTYSFTNGTTADATQVNQNFSDLTGCAAPTASPVFSGNVGIGMTPSNVLDITQSHNSDSAISILNATSGTAADANFRMQAGTTFGVLSAQSQGYTTSGRYVAGGVLLEGQGSGGVQINANSGPIQLFQAAAEAARIGTDGSFLVGTSTNGGWSGNARFESYTAGPTAVSAYTTNGAGNAIVARVDNTGADLIYFIYTGSGVGSVATNGTTTTYNTSSDKRLKTNVVDINPVLARKALAAYHPQQYLLRGKFGVGALAQDAYLRMGAVGIDAVQLGLVTKGDNDTSARERLPSNKPNPKFRQWQMDSSKMIPYVIAAQLDDERQISLLKHQVAALTAIVLKLQRNETASVERTSGGLTGRQASSASNKQQTR